MTSLWVPPGMAFIATGIRQDHDVSAATTWSGVYSHRNKTMTSVSVPLREAFIATGISHDHDISVGTIWIGVYSNRNKTGPWHQCGYHLENL